MATDRVHTYHAEASVLSAKLEQPLRAEILPQAYVNLPGRGGYLSQRAKCFHLETVISFESAYTQVAGNPSDKPKDGWVTLATSVVEGLNVLDVVTADRVVAQISVTHPEKGYVPRVTFLGTRFEGLKIAGVEIEPQIDLDFCTPTKDNQLYLADGSFRRKVEAHRTALASAPADIKQAYSGAMPDTTKLNTAWENYLKKGASRPGDFVVSSLVTGIGQPDGKPPGDSYVNALSVPEFGKIFLGELRVECDSFELSMIRLQMGCVAAGSGTASKVIVNGSTVP